MADGDRNTNDGRLVWLAYRPSCGHLHIGDPDLRVIPAMCPDGVEHNGSSSP